MLKAVRRDDAQVFNLPGRDWLLFVGPENADAQHLTIGYSVFPPGSAPPGHVHDTQEEVIFIVAGKGELVTTEGTLSFEPGTAVYIPAGLHHQTVCYGPEVLEMVTSFSPPVVPGSYEQSVEDAGPDGVKAGDNE